MNEIQEKWKQVCFSLKQWKATGCYIIEAESNDEINIQLEEDSLKISQLKGSTYAKVFKEITTFIEFNLKFIGDFIDLWVKVQLLWIYLEPIFSSEDIMKNLPEEGSKFKVLNGQFKNVSQKLFTDPYVFNLSENSNYLNLLKDIMINLEDI